MSLDSIQDNYFGCAETPIWIPDGFDVSRIQTSDYRLRLETPIPGPGHVTPSIYGLWVDENSTATFSVNGIQYNLVESVLVFGGVHRLPARSAPCSAELLLYFQHVRDFGVQICLCLPIDVGKHASNAYFETLGKGIMKNRPTLATIVPNNPTFLCYRGADLRGRHGAASQNREFCDPVKRITTHYLCLTPTYIAAPDLLRLKTLSGSNLKGPAKPLSPLTNQRLVQLGTLIKGIKLGSKPATVANSGPGIPTSALKCYKLNAEKDIVNDKVYVGGTGRPLKSELEDSESESSDYEAENNAILPGDIQRWIGIVLGVVLGVVICAVIVVFLWSKIFKGYFKAQDLYNMPLSASAITNKLPSIKMPSLCPK